MRYAWDGIRRRPVRSALTALGIGLATALVVILLALSSGIQQSSNTLATESGVDLLATSSNTTLTSANFPPVAQAHPLTTAMPAADPNVAAASPWLIGDLVFGNASLWQAANASAGGAAIPSSWSPTGSGSVGWIPSANSGIEVPAISTGTGFRYPGDPHYGNGTYDGPFTHEVVLDQGLAAVLHVSVGALVWVSPLSVAGPANVSAWFENATAFRVVGISGPFWLIPSALLAFFYLSEMQALTGSASASTDDASIVLIHLTDASNAAADQARLQARFPGLTIFTLNDILGAVANIVNLYRTFGELIGLIGLVVATLFATTVLLMSVDDRSQEIALLRAIGYSRRAVGSFVVQEGLILAGLGLAVGLPVAFVGSYGLNAFLLRLVVGLPNGFSFVAFGASVIGFGVAEVVIIGLVASIAPAARAMALPVAEELRAP